jgi:hypothetical protein
VGIALFCASVGLALALAGLLMVTDHLSLRNVLARTGPESARHLALSLHLVIEHSGAQTVELGGALLGTGIIALSIRRLRRMGS